MTKIKYKTLNILKGAWEAKENKHFDSFDGGKNFKKSVKMKLYAMQRPEVSDFLGIKFHYPTKCFLVALKALL